MPALSIVATAGSNLGLWCFVLDTSSTLVRRRGAIAFVSPWSTDIAVVATTKHPSEGANEMKTWTDDEQQRECLDSRWKCSTSSRRKAIDYLTKNENYKYYTNLHRLYTYIYFFFFPASSSSTPPSSSPPSQHLSEAKIIRNKKEHKMLTMLSV